MYDIYDAIMDKVVFFTFVFTLLMVSAIIGFCITVVLRATKQGTTKLLDVAVDTWDMLGR